VKLYDSGRSPNPRRVRIFLAEKGLSVPLVPVDLGKLEQRDGAYLAVNPRGRTPALELDDGEVITESLAICRYFEELHPEPPLFGTGPLGRARVETWQRRIELELLFPVMHVFRHTHPHMAALENPQVPAWAEANRPRVFDFLAFLDGHLRTRDFVADSFSVADITGPYTIDLMKPARLAVPEELAEVRRWHHLIAERPSAKA